MGHISCHIWALIIATAEPQKLEKCPQKNLARFARMLSCQLKILPNSDFQKLASLQFWLSFKGVSPPWTPTRALPLDPAGGSAPRPLVPGYFPTFLNSPSGIPELCISMPHQYFSAAQSVSQLIPTFCSHNTPKIHPWLNCNILTYCKLLVDMIRTNPL